MGCRDGVSFHDASPEAPVTCGTTGPRSHGNIEPPPLCLFLNFVVQRTGPGSSATSGGSLPHVVHLPQICAVFTCTPAPSTVC